MQYLTLDPFKVLLVEPDHEQALLIRAWLEGTGEIEVLHCESSAEGLLQLRKQRWDLIVADMDAKPAAVVGLSDDIRLSGHGTPVLAIAREQGMDAVRRALRHRAEGLLFRPLARNEFLEQVFVLARDSRRRLLNERKTVLAVGAHPDDVEIGCGGALARHHSRGDEVIILTLSRGTNGGDAVVRTAEAQRAAALLGARLEIGELPDARISEGLETIGLIEEVVRAVSPTHVYTHSRHDAHQDHRNTHLASIVGARDIPNVYCYQAPSSTIEFRPNLFIDISSHIGTKVDAIAAYHSQVSRSASMDADHIRATARYWGRYTGYGMAEPMEVVRQCER
ncbi:MAG: PIG-L family deacetylase [Comamonadaceae bacterium]|nr:PIG-L family deacetylase [Comamonadaceae bacterium]